MLSAATLLECASTKADSVAADRLVDGEYVDPLYTSGVQPIFDVLWTSKDRELVEKYGVWLIQRDRTLGLKVRSSLLTYHFEDRC